MTRQHAIGRQLVALCGVLAVSGVLACGFAAERAHAMTISGTLYSDEGVTQVTNGRTIKIAVGSSTVPTVYSTTTNSGTGVYSFTFPTTNYITATSSIVVWVDASATTTAAVVTRATSSGSIAGLDLYDKRLIVRTVASSGYMTIVDMARYDGSKNASIPYRASTSTQTLVTNAGIELHVWAGTTFVPGGTVTLQGNASISPQDGTLHLDDGSRYYQWATSTYSTKIAGSFLADAGSNFTTVGTVLMNATTTGRIIDISQSSSPNLGKVTFNGTGGGWTFVDSATTSDLTISAGTVTALGSLTVTGSLTQNGTLRADSGTLYLRGVSSVVQGTLTGSSTLGNVVVSPVTFGSDGSVSTVNEAEIATADGRYVYTMNEFNGPWVIEKRDKYTGALDITFGTSSSGVLYIGEGTYYPNVLVNDGTYLYVGGQGGSGYARLDKRFLTTGALDTSFGTSSTGSLFFESDTSGINALTIDGTYLYLGFGMLYGAPGRFEKRLLSTGALDTSFGVSGKISNMNVLVAAMVNDGTYLYVAGADLYNTGWGIQKCLLSTGATSTSFGVSGLVTTSKGYQIDSIVHDGMNLYVAGRDDSYTGMLVKYVMSNGATTTSFGVSGVVMGTYGGSDFSDLLFDGTYLYYLDSSAVNVAYKLNASTGEKDFALPLQNAVYAIIMVDDTYLYTGRPYAYGYAKRILVSGALVDATSTYTFVSNASSTSLTVSGSKTAVTAPQSLSIDGDFTQNGTWKAGNKLYLSGPTGTLSGTFTGASPLGAVTSVPVTAFDTDGVVDGDAASQYAYNVTSDASYLYVAGYDSSDNWRIEKRDKTTGALVTAFDTDGIVDGVAASGHARAITSDDTYLYIAGDDSSNNWRIEKRDKTTGALVTAFDTDGVVDGVAASDTAYALVTDGSYLYIVGRNSSINWRIEKRDKTTGALVTAFDTDGVVDGVAASNVAYAVAFDTSYLYIAGDDDSPNWRIEKRDKTTGALVTTFDTDGVVDGTADTYIVFSLFVDDTSLYIAGDYDLGLGNGRIEKRNKTTGALVTAFNTVGFVDGVTSSNYTREITVNGSYLYSVGSNDSSDFHIEKRDKTTGALVTAFDTDGVVEGDTASSLALTLATDGSYLYIAGSDDSTNWRIEKRMLRSGALVAGTSTYSFLSNATTTSLTVGASTTISAPARLTVTGDFTQQGTWNASSGTMYFDAYASTLSGTLTGSSSLGNLTFMGLAFGTSSPGVIFGDAVGGGGKSVVTDGLYLYIACANNAGTWRIEKRDKATGALVTAFDGDGVVTSGSGESAVALAVDFSYIYIVGDNASGGWRIEKRDKTTGALVAGFGSSGVIAENLSTYYAAAVSLDDSYLYVAGTEDSTNWRIEKRSKVTGDLVTEFDGDGVVNGAVLSFYAYGIALDSSYLYVAGDDDSGTGGWRIEKRDKVTGALVTAFDTDGVVDGVASGTARSINVDSSYVYIAGNNSSTTWRVEKRDKTTGAPVVAFGTNGAVDGTAATVYAYGIASDPSSIYVVGGNSSDTWRIEKRDKTNAALVAAFDGDGVATNTIALGSARGVVVDAPYLYIVGSHNTYGDLLVERRDLTAGALAGAANSFTFSSNASTSDFTIPGASTTVTTATLHSIAGNYTNNGTTTFTGGVYFNGSSVQTLSGSMTGLKALPSVTFLGAGAKTFANNASTTNFTVAAGTATVTAPTLLTISGDFTQGGTWLSGSMTYFDAYNGTISGTLTATSSLGNVTFTATSAANTVTLTSNASTSNLTIASASTTLVAPSLLDISGNFTNNRGTLSPGTGTVTLTGGNQTLTGTTTFYNLVKRATTTSTTTFEAAARFTVQNNLVLAGAPGAVHKLRSSSDGSYWYVDPQGRHTAIYLDVKDSYNANATAIGCSSGCVNSNHNVNWDFGNIFFASDADQSFYVGEATTTLAMMTIAEPIAGPLVTAANDIRISIATTSTNFRFDTDTTDLTFGGSGASKVANPVSYEDGGATLVIPVSADFAAGETLTISGARVGSFAAISSTAGSHLGLYTEGSISTVVATDTTTIRITGALTLADHAAGQVTNAFSFLPTNDTTLFAFMLTPAYENATVTSLTLSLSAVHNIDTSKVANIRLYRDYNSNGTLDGGDEAVGGAGALATYGFAGTTTFSSAFLATTSGNYIVVADLSGTTYANSLTIGLPVSGVVATGTTVGAAMGVVGSVTSVEHRRGRSFETGGTKDAGGPVGGASSMGVMRSGGGGGGGSQVEPTPPPGETLSSEVGSFAPTESGAVNNEWTSGSNGFLSDELYASAGSEGLRQTYSMFGFSVPDSNTVQGIVLKLEASASTATGTFDVLLSWDGGSSFTTAKRTMQFTTSDGVYTLGSESDTWGVSWTPTYFTDGNFVVRIIAHPDSNTVRLDALRVHPYHALVGGGSGGGGAI